MTQGPVSPDPGRDDDPARDPGEPGRTPRDGSLGDPGGTPDEFSGDGEQELPPPVEDWLTDDEWLDWLYTVESGEEEDPEEDDSGQAARGAKPARAGQGSRAPKGSRAAKASTPKAARVPQGKRRGPGQPGSARRLPGDSPGPVGAFATGQLMDTAPGGPVVFGHAEYAAGEDARFAGATDDELTGLICGLDRAEAAACALKHAAVAELIRRSPEDGCVLEGPAQMPGTYDEFTEAELADALAETRQAAAGMLGLAQDLQVKLPGTNAAFRSGVLRLSKVEIIARAVANLDPAEARAAEARVLERAGRLTPGGLRSAIAAAVIEVAPDKAVKRREEAARNARVQRWLEDSGNAALMGRELPPAEVLAADQRISWWAGQLRAAGLDGDMDQLRARAYLDILLNKDSRPARPAAGQDGPGCEDREPGGPDGGNSGDGGVPDDRGDGGSGPSGRDGPCQPPTASVLPAGFAGDLHLTTPLAVLLNLAERPGEIAGLGPVDPALARDLAHAAAQNPRTTYCVTVTDEQGHAIGHGCARPEPKNRARTGQPPEPRPPRDHSPPAWPGTGPRPGFTFTASGDDGPPGGYGTWRLSTGLPGRPDLLIALDPIATDTCDHRFEARGHDPGVKLKHLTQIRHATCTGPTCRRPAQQCDFEHNIPYEAGGATCMCNGGPKCRHEHRIKQHPRWKVEQITPATFRWTTPSGRQYTTEPTRYPI